MKSFVDICFPFLLYIKNTWLLYDVSVMQSDTPHFPLRRFEWLDSAAHIQF